MEFKKFSEWLKSRINDKRKSRILQKASSAGSKSPIRQTQIYT
jgi:hypothetical protein